MPVFFYIGNIGKGEAGNTGRQVEGRAPRSQGPVPGKAEAAR